MKNFLLLLMIFFIGVPSYAYTTVVRTYDKGPFARTINSYYQPCQRCDSYYAENYYNNGYYAPNYYPERYYNYRPSYYTPYYERQERLPFQHVKRTIYRYSGATQKSKVQKDCKGCIVSINYDKNSNSSISKDLFDLEYKVMNKTFQQESLNQRLSRLEENVFGAIQDGDETSRYLKIKEVVDHRNIYNSNNMSNGTCYGGYIPKQEGISPWRKTINSLGMIFSGCPTGWTPGVSPYDSYVTDQGGISQTNYDNWGGYSYSNVRRGSGAGIQILD